MKEFFQELVKQKSSLLILAGMLLLLLGITNGIQMGTTSITIEPTYRIVSIIIGLFLVLTGIVFIWKDSSYAKPQNNISNNYSGQAATIPMLLEKASQIDAIGYSLRTLIHSRQHDIAKAIINGASVRLIVIDPDGKSIQVMEGIKPTTGVAEDIRRSLNIAKKNILEESKQSIRGKFEIRVIDWIPSCSLLVLDATTENGWMEIGIFPPNYKKAVGHKLYIHLMKKKDKIHFDEYAVEFNELWEMAKPYEH
jgi:hypothetical protein